jgi:hypothetical protein
MRFETDRGPLTTNHYSGALMTIFRRTIETGITINAPTDGVWGVLTDFGAYPQWNPFIRTAEGLLEVGHRLKLFTTVPKGWKMTLRPQILAVEPGRSFRWLGKTWVYGLFDGTHAFALEPACEDRTRFVQRETFSGILVPLLGRFVAAGAHRGFEAMNAALKIRAEKTDLTKGIR